MENEFDFSCDVHGKEAIAVSVQGSQILEMEYDDNGEPFWAEGTFYDDGPNRVFCDICGNTLGFLDEVIW